MVREQYETEILAPPEKVRVLAIDLADETDLVQIRGTQIVPEFGSMSGLIFAIMLGSAVIAVRHAAIKVK